MRRRRQTTYEYEYKEHSPYKHHHKRNPYLKALDTFLFILVIPVPLIGLVLHLSDIGLSPVHLGLYTAATQTLAGLLFLILTACGVGGFGKVGYFFTHTRGKRWMTTEEAKGNTYLFGFFMLIIGVLVGLLTLKLK